ncbi:hypothetical protein [Phenylobacterium sp.]|uniref:hypothetical protein n=1 Tax=Phenylobacterium sp. TaxID=1871053 RepID=UPI0027339727|nr:hypothetical protein [Phenylobacterium sp.]MDP3852596.1 hypothetical protein [Phenylobacterium sp.]
MTSAERKTDYDLTCWYLNSRRVIELVGAEQMTPQLQQLASIGNYDDHWRTLAALGFLKDQLTDWVRRANPPTLGQLIARGQLGENRIFTHFSNYYFKGLPKVSAALNKHAATVPMAEAYSKLDDVREGLRISFNFHHEHLTSTSSWVELSGQKRVLVVGVTNAVSTNEIRVTPIVIAYPYVDILSDTPSLIGSNWINKLELFIDDIDTFEHVREFDRPRAKRDLEILRSIPEADIKQAFAEIIGEPTVPKDWGGERSDLITTYLEVGNTRIAAAFAFKGPAKFHPMTVADLGKNGDQIDRLFSEPAEVMVLQHCHEITPPVRSMMRAYAQRMGQLKLACVIDGYDTLRILGAYRKCGVPTPKRRPPPRNYDEVEDFGDL